MEQSKTQTVQPLRELDGPEERPERTDQISLLDGLEWLVRRWYWIVAPALLFAALFFLMVLTRPEYYVASATFIPEESTGGPTRPSGGDGLLALLLDRAGGGGYYADVIKSRTVLGEVAEAEYVLETEEGGTEEGTLPEIWGITGERPEKARQIAVASLTSMIDVQTLGSGMVWVGVTSERPDLAEQIAGNVLRAVDLWNRERRQTSATIERDFIGDRVESARGELLEAEDELRVWLEENRRYENSPEKVFERQRLQRRVDLKQQVYTSLSQTLEQVRLTAVRNTPALAVLDTPQTGLEPLERPFAMKTLMGLVFGGALGFFLVFLRDWYRGTLPIPATWPRRATSG